VASTTCARCADLERELDQLREAIASRDLIGQAKGIVMATTGCDADAAFQVLVKQSQHENRKLRDVAAELIARPRTAAGPPVEGADRSRRSGISWLPHELVDSVSARGEGARRGGMVIERRSSSRVQEVTATTSQPSSS
jgi:hypothetical protein